MIAIPMGMPDTCDMCPIEGCEYINGKFTCPLIEIVQCKECKNSHMTYDGKCKYCDLERDDDDNFIECYFDGDHFCSDGERRE